MNAQPEAPDWSALADLHSSLLALMPNCPPAGRQALERSVQALERDLLARKQSDLFIVGMAGPNNAGKSSVFNGLCGLAVSPARPTGGATRRLCAATHKVEGLQPRGFSNPEIVSTDAGEVQAALSKGPKDSLLLMQVPSLPANLLLVDAPDFDSVLEDHRQTAESLLAVTDLALVVVTRHCYQNQEVVEFLQAWLGEGRPYALIYNEASSEEIARLHVGTLAESIQRGKPNSVPPLACFFALRDGEVASGAQALMPQILGPQAKATGLTLGQWLQKEVRPEELQQRAWQASLRSLRKEIEHLHSSWTQRESTREQLSKRARESALTLAREVTESAMPMGPVLDAFRRVLDRRPGLVRSTYRTGLRKASQGLAFVWSKVSGKIQTVEGEQPDTLKDAEAQAFRPLWAPFIERLQAQLMAAGAAGDTDWKQLLEQDLHPSRLAAGQAWVLEHLETDPEVYRQFTEYCEQLVEEDLKKSGNEWALQAMLDLSHLLPAAVAGVIIVKSGMLMTDVAVGSMGALSSMAIERMSKFLGTQTAARARERWSQLRSEAWTEWVLQGALPQTFPTLAEPNKRPIEALEKWLKTNR